MDSKTLHDVAGSLELYSSGPNLDTEVKLHEAMPVLIIAIACFFSVGHSNQIGYLSHSVNAQAFDDIHHHFTPAQGFDNKTVWN